MLLSVALTLRRKLVAQTGVFCQDAVYFVLQLVVVILQFGICLIDPHNCVLESLNVVFLIEPCLLRTRNVANLAKFFADFLLRVFQQRRLCGGKWNGDLSLFE